MSGTKEDRKPPPFVLPSDLPKCSCFSKLNDPNFVMFRCADAASIGHKLCGMFQAGAVSEQLCPTALPFLADLMLLNILCFVAKEQGPALSYGSQEMEWEVGRLLTGLEARMQDRNREAHARGRELGLTEETMRAMRERDAGDGNLQ